MEATHSNGLQEDKTSLGCPSGHLTVPLEEVYSVPQEPGRFRQNSGNLFGTTLRNPSVFVCYESRVQSFELAVRAVHLSKALVSLKIPNRWKYGVL